MRALLAFVLTLLAATPALAGNLTVTVRDNDGKPVRDAVVTVHPAAGVPNRPIHFSWPLRLVQKDIQFQPYVLIAPRGATVAFSNFDPVRHHVYSFSRGNRFEIKLFGRQETRTYRFNTVGVAAIGCNIHDQMLAYVKVVDTPWAAKTSANGDVTLSAVPAGEATLRVWHPGLQARGNELSRPITVSAAAGRQAVTANIAAKGPARPHSPTHRYP